MALIRAEDDAAWAPLKAYWDFRRGTTYLNHGSFGPPPRPVREARQTWQDALDSQPMDFFVRQFEPAWLATRNRVARFVTAPASDLIFVENATVGMNIVADSFPLSAGDEVVLTDHEYGAVERQWRRACLKSGAELAVVALPLPFRSASETADAIFSQVTERTRLIVVSHVAFATPVILPVAEICRRAQERRIAVAIDGPHAVAQIPLDIGRLDCDFYAASCHKWLSGPFGSGFLYVHPRQQNLVRPPVLSWGRLPPARIESWSDEFVWSGTRNPVAFLAVPAAIDFLEGVGLDAFRARTHWLAQYARRKLVELTQLDPQVPDDPAWYGSMTHVPLPPPRNPTPLAPGQSPDEVFPISNALTHIIWQRLGIETPVVEVRGRRCLRVSCHLYNDTEQIDRLVAGLKTLLAEGH
jgi:isopenicillin-N epimerase